jgi:hypothetical protein
VTINVSDVYDAPVIDPVDNGEATIPEPAAPGPGQDTPQPSLGTEPTAPVADDLDLIVEESQLNDTQNVKEVFSNAHEQADHQEAILYLTDDNEIDTRSERHEDEDGFIYYDNSFIQELSSYNYSTLDFQVAGSSNGPFDLPDFSKIDFNSDELVRILQNGDYDSLRAEMDDAFGAEQRSAAIKTNIVSATTATFTIGLVSYLLRAGSLMASMMSTLPLWRGFDPITVFAGKKKKRTQEETTQTDDSRLDNILDGEAE